MKSLRTPGAGWFALACWALLGGASPVAAQPGGTDPAFFGAPPSTLDSRGLCAAKPVVAPSNTLEFKPVPVPPVPPPPKPVSPVETPAHQDANVILTNCSSCGGGGLLGSSPGPMGYSSCGCGGGGCCVPGRLHECSCCDADSCCGRILCGLYNCICCPDPCYDPHWIAIADAAFFVDGARPITQMRLRWDDSFGIPRPDRAEYWAAQEGVKGPKNTIRTLDVEEFSLYNEAAVSRFGLFVQIPYREVDLFGDPAVAAGTGFADMQIGTKSLLLDCELLQITFQFKTFIPIGTTGTGVSTGHVSLEPALVFGLKLAPGTYLQGEAAYWIPLGGDSGFQSDVFHAHLSLNQMLYRFLPDVQLIGTCEISEWSIISGNYTFGTDANGNSIVVNSSGSMVNAGFGLRLNICDKIDFGVGTQFHLSGNRWYDNEVRAEFRWRF
jgi:hypothetical protein